MRPRPWLLPLLAALAAAASCVLPGATPPTPFIFPTPNETLTAVFAPTETPVVLVGTITPTPPSTTAPTVITPAAFVPTATFSSLSTRPNGTALEAAWLNTLPTIDGDLGDWSSLPYSGDKVVYGASRWTGVEDDSAKFGLGWDATHLYLAVQVTDDKYVQLATGADIWKGDEVELQFDADLAADYYTASLSADDRTADTPPLPPGDVVQEKPPVAAPGGRVQPVASSLTTGHWRRLTGSFSAHPSSSTAQPCSPSCTSAFSKPRMRDFATRQLRWMRTKASANSCSRWASDSSSRYSRSAVRMVTYFNSALR